MNQSAMISWAITGLIAIALIYTVIDKSVFIDDLSRELVRKNRQSEALTVLIRRGYLGSDFASVKTALGEVAGSQNPVELVVEKQGHLVFHEITFEFASGKLVFVRPYTEFESKK